MHYSPVIRYSIFCACPVSPMISTLASVATVLSSCSMLVTAASRWGHMHDHQCRSAHADSVRLPTANECHWPLTSRPLGTMPSADHITSSTDLLFLSCIAKYKNESVTTQSIPRLHSFKRTMAFVQAVELGGDWTQVHDNATVSGTAAWCSIHSHFVLTNAVLLCTTARERERVRERGRTETHYDPLTVLYVLVLSLAAAGAGDSP
jgi:hypothetical protein